MKTRPHENYFVPVNSDPRRICLQKVLNVFDGLIQVWIKVLVEFKVWYFVPVNSACMLAQIRLF